MMRSSRSTIFRNITISFSIFLMQKTKGSLPNGIFEAYKSYDVNINIVNWLSRFDARENLKTLAPFNPNFLSD